MVGYTDVLHRHVGYVGTMMGVICLSKFTWTLTLLLSIIAFALRWHRATPYAFLLLSSFFTSISAGLCVRLSVHTWWYASPIDVLGVPPWLFPLNGIFAHWVVDAYWLITLQDLRKSALPGGSL